MLIPAFVVAAFAATAPAAMAGSTVTFPEGQAPVTSVSITDPGSSSSTVHLTVTAANPADLANTKVFLGNDYSVPYFSVGVDGVRDTRYDNNVDTGDEELSSQDCLVYAGSLRYDDVPVTVSGGGTSFSADLPKGELIAWDTESVTVGIVGNDAGCNRFGVAGLAVDYVNTKQDVDGISWDAPAAPVVTAITGGRHQVALSFDQEPGTTYDIYRVVDGVREATPFREDAGRDGNDVQVVLTTGPDDQPLAAGTQYAFQVRATRNFNTWVNGEAVQPTSPFSAVATASTNAIQTLQFNATPAASTTARTAQFGWAMTANEAGEAPSCWLDEESATPSEVACSTTGATVTGLSVGAHTLRVYPSDGEGVYTYKWTVVDAPVTTTPPPAVPTAPTKTGNPTDPDGDGISNNWLVGGKVAPAPATPKTTVTGGRVKLKLASAPKGAKSIRVYRADGKGGYTLVKTLAAKSKTFTDSKVKPGHTYKYKTVAVNAKGQQGKASGVATAKVKKKR